MSREFASALVLGGGGLTGISWETGILFGLEHRGIHLRSAEMLVGTSAGSVVAAQITSTISLGELYQRQVDAVVTEIPGKIGPLALLRYAATMAGRDQKRALAKLGSRALKADTVEESVRRAVIENRLPSHEWPATALRITAINAETGEFTVFDEKSGVGLVDAVGASCAVPLVWPCVTIGGQRYFDGGLRSSANVDLAQSAEKVVVLAPQTKSLRKAMSPTHQLAALRTPGIVVSPDREAASLMGSDPLDPTARAASARAGFDQAERVADAVGAVWN